MATSYPFSPIVRDGLIHYYDAGNSKSYPGTGTNWNNLIGQSSGILTNSPTFSNLYFSFNGSNTYVQIDTITVPAIISFNFWVRPMGVTTMTILGDNGSSNNRGWAAQLVMSSGEIRFTGSDTGLNVNIATRNTTNAGLTSSNWYNICIVKENATLNFYKNGVLLSHDSGTIHTTYNNSTIFTEIGALSGASPAQVFTGDISVVGVYNTILSTGEILQNYNALKNRFI